MFLIFVAIGAIFKERELIAGGIGPVGLAVLLFNLCSYAVGYGIPRLLKAPRAEAIAIAIRSQCLIISAVSVSLDPELGHVREVFAVDVRWSDARFDYTHLR